MFGVCCLLFVIGGLSFVGYLLLVLCRVLSVVGYSFLVCRRWSLFVVCWLLFDACRVLLGLVGCVMCVV